MIRVLSTDHISLRVCSTLYPFLHTSISLMCSLFSLFLDVIKSFIFIHKCRSTLQIGHFILYQDDFKHLKHAVLLSYLIYSHNTCGNSNLRPANFNFLRYRDIVMFAFPNIIKMFLFQLDYNQYNLSVGLFICMEVSVSCKLSEELKTNHFSPLQMDTLILDWWEQYILGVISLKKSVQHVSNPFCT